MGILNNPFVIYGYKGAKYFCDREKETEKIITRKKAAPFIGKPSSWLVGCN